MPYSQSFKKQILAQCRSSASISTIAKEHSVPRSTIYRWHKEENLVETSDRVYSSKDIKALERRVAKLEKINAILKGVPCTVHAPLRERLDALEQLHNEYDVHTLCEAPEVSRGTYYNHIRRNKRDDVWYKKREEKYRILIRDVFYEFDQVLGANKICAVLKERGHAVTPKYVARIMDDLGLTSIRTDAKRIYDSQRKNPPTFCSSNSHPRLRTRSGAAMSPVSSSGTIGFISVPSWISIPAW